MLAAVLAGASILVLERLRRWYQELVRPNCWRRWVDPKPLPEVRRPMPGPDRHLMELELAVPSHLWLEPELPAVPAPEPRLAGRPPNQVPRVDPIRLL